MTDIYASDADKNVCSKNLEFRCIELLSHTKELNIRFFLKQENSWKVRVGKNSPTDIIGQYAGWWDNERNVLVSSTDLVHNAYLCRFQDGWVDPVISQQFRCKIASWNFWPNCFAFNWLTLRKTAEEGQQFVIDPSSKLGTFLFEDFLVDECDARIDDRRILKKAYMAVFQKYCHNVTQVLSCSGNNCFKVCSETGGFKMWYVRSIDATQHKRDIWPFYLSEYNFQRINMEKGRNAYKVLHRGTSPTGFREDRAIPRRNSSVGINFRLKDVAVSAWGEENSLGNCGHSVSDASFKYILCRNEEGSNRMFKNHTSYWDNWVDREKRKRRDCRIVFAISSGQDKQNPLTLKLNKIKERIKALVCARYNFLSSIRGFLVSQRIEINKFRRNNGAE
jgi:hypothetical protein